MRGLTLGLGASRNDFGSGSGTGPPASSKLLLEPASQTLATDGILLEPASQVSGTDVIILEQ